MGLIQLAGLLTLPLLRAYNGQLGKGGRPAKWFFYWFIPSPPSLDRPTQGRISTNIPKKANPN